MKITKETHSYGSHKRQRLTVHHDMDHPAGQNRPGILMIHGGYWADEASLGDWPSRFASDGYVAIETRYRLNSDATWPAPSNDVRAALDWIRRNAATWNLDPHRVAAFGSSAGGHLAAMLGVTRAGLNGVVALSPPMSPYRAWSDADHPVDPWPEKKARLREEAEKLAGAAPKKGTSGWSTWVDMTVYQHVSGYEPPMLLAHFEEDFIPVAHSMDLMRHLTDVGMEDGGVSVSVVSGKGHALQLMETHHVKQAVAAFLAEVTSKVT